MTWWMVLLLVMVGTALVQKSLDRAFTEVCSTIVRGLGSLGADLRSWSGGKREALSRLLDAENLRHEGRWRWSYAIGSTILAVACGVFLLLDWEVITLSLAALGWAHSSRNLGIDLGLLVGLSVFGPLLICLWLLVELWGYPHFLPAQRYGQREKVFWRGLCGTACALSLLAIPVMGLFRLEAERQTVALERLEAAVISGTRPPGSSGLASFPGHPAGPEERWRNAASIVSVVLIPLAVTCAAAVTWHFGFSVVLLHLLTAGVLALLSVALRPVEWVVAALRGLIGLSHVVLWHTLHGLSRAGTILSRPLITLARGATDWAHEELRRDDRRDLRASSRMLLIVALALTSWSRDVEIPDQPAATGAEGEENPAAAAPEEVADKTTDQIAPIAEHTPVAETVSEAPGEPAQIQGSGFGEEPDANWDPYRT